MDSSNTAERQDRQKEGQYLTGGYRVRKYQDETFLVPDFLVPSTEQAIAAINERKKYEEAHTRIGVTFYLHSISCSNARSRILQPRDWTGKPGDPIAGGMVNAPVDPVRNSPFGFLDRF